MKNYYELECLKDIYLEDSYVLKIEQSEHELIFFVEAVLTEENPNYEEPKKNEQYCYKKGCIKFKELKEINWVKRDECKYMDPNGDVDFGNIDFFKVYGNKYHLSGDWGEVWVDSSSVTFFLEE